jgi:RNase adaptor protein for sRNA GlmZ degradation
MMIWVILIDFILGIKKENNVIVYLENNEKTEEIRKRHIFYRSQEEMAYFLLTEEALNDIKERVQNEIADIVITDTELSLEQLRDEILEKLRSLT